MSFRGREGVVEDVAQEVEPAFPDSAVLGDPVLDRVHRAGVEAAGADPTGLLGTHEPAALEHVEVLQHCRQRHAERRRELAHRGGPPGELHDDRATVAVGQSVERQIELLGLSARRGGDRNTSLR